MKTSPTPWTVHFGFHVMSADASYDIAECDNQHDAALIVEAVNAYERLKAENERLRKIANEAIGVLEGIGKQEFAWSDNHVRCKHRGEVLRAEFAALGGEVSDEH